MSPPRYVPRDYSLPLSRFFIVIVTSIRASDTLHSQTRHTRLKTRGSVEKRGERSGGEACSRLALAWPLLFVFGFVPILLFAGKSGLLSMLMRKKEDDQPVGKKDEEEDDEAADTYQQDKPPEKTPEPTTQPVWRPPASRQQTKSLTENFPCDLRESWCELRMYICSTGDDFLSERTAIVNALLPELQVRCASRRIRISAVDCWTSTGSSLRFSQLCHFTSQSPQQTLKTPTFSRAFAKLTAAQFSLRSAGGGLAKIFPMTYRRPSSVYYRPTTSFLRSLLILPTKPLYQTRRQLLLFQCSPTRPLITPLLLSRFSGTPLK
jgi:hypothetical protein